MDVASSKRQVVVLLYPGCTVVEVLELATRLVAADLTVVYAASDLTSIRDQSRLAITPDSEINDIDTSLVDLVIIPGGDPQIVLDDQDVYTLLNEVASRGGVIAGICAGVLVVAAAGLVRERRITHNYRPPWAPTEIVDFVSAFWNEAHVEPDLEVGVVVDGNIITALPNATAEFTATTAREIGICTADEARRLTRHLQGEHVVELYEVPARPKT